MEKAVPFRRLDWRIWRHSYISETPEADRIAWVSLQGDVAGHQGEEAEQRWMAKVRDISLGGIILIVNRRFESGALLKVEVQKSGESKPRVLSARVISVTTRPNGLWQLGCCYARELSDEDLRTFGAERVRPASPDGRAWVRFPCDMDTMFYSVVAADHGKCRARVINISAGGIGLQVDRPFEHGTLLRLVLQGSMGQPSRTVQARVVRNIKQDDGTWVLGCAFVTDLSDEDLEALM